MDSITDTTDLWGTNQYDSNTQLILETIENYRSEWWKEQEFYVEVWLEKRALANIIYPITNKYGVFLSVAGGYPTLSQINSSKDRFDEYQDKDIVILYLGDLDPSGKDMPRYLGDRLEEIEVYDISTKEVALTKDDVLQYNLPKNPFKPKDIRVNWYIEKYDIDYAVELDALSPNVLKQKVQQSILAHTNLASLEKAKERDEKEKKKWKQIIERIIEEGGNKINEHIQNNGNN